MKYKIHQLNILQYMKKLEKYFFYRKKYFKMKKIKQIIKIRKKALFKTH